MSHTHRLDNPRNTDRLARPRRDRGIAMLLVLIALVVTTVLVGATLTSQELAPFLGENATDAAEATWSAESAVNFAVGAIAQSDDLVALLGNDDTLTNTLTIGDANLAVTIENLDGLPPTSEDREFVVRAVASVDGVTKILEKRVTRLLDGDITDAVDPYLAEFAVFATERAEFQTGSTTGIWKLSPEYNSSFALAKIGVSFSPAAEFDIAIGALFERAGFYADVDASLALESIIQATDGAAKWLIPYDIPTPPSDLHFAYGTIPDFSADVLPADGTSTTVNAEGRYGRLEAQNNASVTIDGANGLRYQFQSINLVDATLVIRNAVEIHVREDFLVDGGSVVLEDAAASVVFYVARDLRFENSAKVGITPPDIATGSGVVSQYRDPRAFRILAISTNEGGNPDPHWEFQTQSATIAFIHNPLGRVHLLTGAVVYGHAVAREFQNQTGSALYYCPTMDNHLGYSEPDGPLYDINANPITEYADLILDAATLESPESFTTKLNVDYAILESSGDLDSYELNGGTRTVTETTGIGGTGILN